MSWRRLNGSRILLPIKEAVEKTIQKDVEFFAWEKLDYVDKIKAAFDN